MKKRRGIRCASALAAGVMTCAATADYTAAVEVGYWVSATDFGGAQVDVYVVDVYMLSNDLWEGTDGSGDTLLNVYNWNTVGAPSAGFFQSFTSTGWLAQNAGGPFDSEALQIADSFVTIGGFGPDVRQAPGAAAGMGLDPSFGGNGAAAPGENAGWYNGSPPSYYGAAMAYDIGTLGTLIGRFSSTEEFSLEGTMFEATWNQGLGTNGSQGMFTVGGGDCNQNDIPDSEDIANGTSTDCNANEIPDECELDDGVAADCNGNGILDECDIADGLPDCDGDGVPDECEVAEGLDLDYNQNGVPDSCEALGVPGDFATIAEAITSAPENSVVFVEAGFYEQPVVLDRAIALVAPNGPEATRLDGSKSLGPVVIVDDAPTGAILAGFTIRAGDPSGERPMGGGIVGVDSRATIADCVIVGNTGMEGGGLRFEGGEPTVVGCEIRHNLSYGAGGGVYAKGGLLLVNDTTFAANIALQGIGHALGSIEPTQASIEDCSIVDHAAVGSVVHSFASAGVVPVNFEVFDSTIANNAGTAIEGGIPNVEVRNCLIENNGGDGVALAEGWDHRVDDSVIRGNGGTGLVVATGLDSIFSIRDNTICGNTGGALDGLDPTDLFGAGNIVLDDRCPDLVVPDDADTIQLAIDTALDGERIAVRPGDWAGFENAGRDLEVIATEGRDATFTAAITASSAAPSTALVRGFTIGDAAGLGPMPAVSITDASPTLDACRITGGTDSGMQVASGTPTIIDTIVEGNESPQFGGGIRLQAGTLTLDGVTVTGNAIPLTADSRGGGVYVQSGAELVLIDTTICDNVRENLANFGTVSDQGGNTVCLAFDCDENGVEDAADIGDAGRPDCNGNLVPDDCDIADETSLDCDGNGVPDECDIAGGIADCDGNGVIDSCEVADGSAPDCNDNGIPDVCDLANGSPDLDLDGVPDECQPVLVFTVPDRFTTIMSAVDAAPSGSIVSLAPGSYPEAIDLGEKNLVLEGDATDPSTTVLDGTGVETTILTIAGGQDSTTVIRGLTIAHGRFGTPEPGNPSIIRGAGMLVDGASPVIEDCVFDDNRTGYGGGLHLTASAATVARTSFVGNVATADGGAVMCVDSNVAFIDCDFDGNLANGNGGAMRVDGGDATITSCTLTANDAFQGGGLFWYAIPGTEVSLLVDGCEITENTAATLGGGVWSRLTGNPVEFRDTIVCDNEPDEIYGAYSDLGGGELCVCPGDFNGDGVVGSFDLGFMLSVWGTCGDAPCVADLDLDGQVDALDLGLFLGDWGLCP